jgi:hypothetical protein
MQCAIVQIHMYTSMLVCKSEIGCIYPNTYLQKYVDMQVAKFTGK